MKLFAFVLCGLTLVANNTTGLLPDMTFQFVCEPPLTHDLISSKAREFLLLHQFRVLDRRAVQIEAGVTPLFEEDVLALKEGAIVKLLKIPGMQRASLALYTAPTTKHDVQLEHDLLTFFRDQLDCSVYLQDQNDNTSASKGTYDSESALIERYLNQATSLKGNK